LVEEELDLRPPWGATGFEPTVVLEKDSVCVIQNGRHEQNKRSSLQARLQGIYSQDETSFVEKDLIGLALQWNTLDSTDTGYIIRKSGSLKDKGSPGQIISDTFQTRLHGLYSQNPSPDKKMNFMRLVKEWNNSDSQDKDRKLSMENEKIYVLGEEEHVNTGLCQGTRVEQIFRLRYKACTFRLTSLETRLEQIFRLGCKACTDRLMSLETRV